MSSPLGIAPPQPEKHNLCTNCAKLKISAHGCLMRHCPSCEGPLKFTTRICLRCSQTKHVCQVCETPLPSKNESASDGDTYRLADEPPTSGS